MITLAVLRAPTIGWEEPSSLVRREVILFRGMRGNVERSYQDPERLCIFTVGKSGARYLVPLDSISFEYHEED